LGGGRKLEEADEEEQEERWRERVKHMKGCGEEYKAGFIRVNKNC
jgi:hypothetical protein